MGRGRMNSKGKAVAMMILIAAAMLMMPSCQRKPVMAHSRFVNLPANGWQRNMPLVFEPVYDDSSRTYQLTLAVRHDNTYSHANLSLVVDMIAVDSVVNRQKVNIVLADEYGNWTGAGFGVLYQDKVRIASVIDPGDARSVVVWQAMDSCDVLQGLVNVGVIASPL